MELFSGNPATELIGSPLPQILEAIYKLCEAVDFVYSKRIIHRDIKPANILVQANANGNGFDIRLSDFGLAKFANSSSSVTGDVNFLGTIAYCAPEQIMREELVHRADIYSLGLVVYGLSRKGQFEEAVARGGESLALVEKILTRSVALQELGRALIQASKYEEAETTLCESLKCLKADLFYIDFSIQNFSLYPEAIVGPLWSQGPKFVIKAKRNKASWAAMKARFWALSFPNMRAHTLRVSGRVAAACGKSRKAIKYFDRALLAAKKFGNRSEYARTLIDKSRMLKDDAARNCREEGLRLLQDLRTVLPAAEIALFASHE